MGEFPHSGKKRFFPVYNAVQWGKHMQIQSLLAMNFSLINGCGTCENKIRGYSFILSGACKFTNIIIATKK